MGIENIIVRLEEPKDYRTVEELTRAAFDNPDRIDRSKIDCPIEHHMVHKLREKDGIMKLDFVVEMNGRIVGHIIYSNAHILRHDVLLVISNKNTAYHYLNMRYRG